MTTRRHLGPLVLAALLVAPAAPRAQDAAGAAAAGTGAPSTTPAKKPRRPARRQARQRPPAEPPTQQSAPMDMEHRLEAAPVPNRNLEAPRTGDAGARTRLSPSVIHRPLPSQGMATEGANNIQEERLFFPAPGARLNVPFSY